MESLCALGVKIIVVEVFSAEKSREIYAEFRRGLKWRI